MTIALLLPSTDGEIDVVGDPIRIDQWSFNQYATFTVAIYVQNFQGRIFLDASLETNPSEHDWFPIFLTQDSPYIQFPIIYRRPTGENGGDTGVEAFNFRANILWLRARMNRSSYMVVNNTLDLDIAMYGVVKQILIGG